MILHTVRPHLLQLNIPYKTAFAWTLRNRFFWTRWFRISVFSALFFLVPDFPTKQLVLFEGANFTKLFFTAFCTKVLRGAFLYLPFRFVHFCARILAQKLLLMLVKLTQVLPSLFDPSSKIFECSITLQYIHLNILSISNGFH